MRPPTLASLAGLLLAGSASARFIIYADEWHPDRPTTAADRAGIDHVVLAFVFANSTASFQPTKPSISTIRSEFPKAKVMIAVGGWGDNIGFDQASESAAGIAKFAADIQTMLTNTGADGVDIDWEYPAGNGADYKKVPNSGKTDQVESFPKLLAATRKAIGNDKILSIAVPGKKIDMTAFTEETGPEIWAPVDYINIMAYDLMNRRDQVTDHHTSVEGAKEAVENYLAISAPPEKINLGFAFYAKYFTTAGACGASALGCAVVSAEDSNGDDTHKSGAWTFEKAHMAPYDKSAIKPSYDGKCGADVMTSCSTGCCSQYGNCGVTPEHCSGGCQHDFGTGCTDPDVFGSWQKALKKGVTDEQAGGEYYFDDDQKLFWTWDTPALIERKFTEIVDEYELGGVMAWSLGEDSYDWSHIKEISSEVAKRSAVAEHSVEVERPDQPVSPESVELEELTEPQEPTEPSESTELPEPTEFPEEFPEHIGHAGHAGRPTYTERPEYTSRPKLLERPVYSTRLERPERPKRPEIPKRPQRPVDPELQADTEELSGGRNAAPEDDGEEWGTERQGWEWFGK